MTNKIFLKIIPETTDLNSAWSSIVKAMIGAKTPAKTAAKGKAAPPDVPILEPFQWSDAPTASAMIHYFGVSKMTAIGDAKQMDTIVKNEIENNPDKYLSDIKKLLKPKAKLASLGSMIVKVRQINKKERIWAYWVVMPYAAFFAAKQTKIEFAQKPIPEKQKPAKGSTTAESGDITVAKSNGDKLVKIKLSNIPLYVTTFKNIFTLLDEKIKYYKIEMDTPFNPKHYVTQISNFYNKLKGIIDALPVTVQKGKKDSSPEVALVFSKDYKELKTVSYKGQQTKKKIEDTFFKDQTTNALIGSLSALYDMYNAKWSVQGGVTSVFLAQDEIKSFLNQYIIPKPFITTSAVTEKIVEKFILGDARLLDDTLYNAYRVPGDEDGEFKARFKIKMDEQIGQQYEKIGDFLGIKFGTGKFKEIEDLDDLYEQLLDHIDVEDLIALSAKCLMKLLPIEEWLDKICDGVLEEFDKHQEKLIQALGKMEDPYAKVVAEELTEIYYHFMDGAVEYTGQIAEGLLKKTIELGKESAFASTWSSINNFTKFYDKNEVQLQELKELNADPDKVNDAENTIAAKMARNQSKLDKLEDVIASAKDRLKPFGQNIPAQEVKILEAYQKERDVIRSRVDDLKDLSDGVADKIKLLEMLREVIPEMMLLSPALTAKQKITLVEKYRNNLPKELKIKGKTKITEKTIQGLKSVALTNLNKKKLQDLDLSAKRPPELNKLFDKDPLFEFTGFSGMPIKDQKVAFRLSLLTLQKLYGAIEKYSTSTVDTSKFNDFGTKTKDAVLNELFKKRSKKRYLLCLAIYSAIPAAAYMISSLMEDPEGTARYLAKQGKQIAKGFKRRYEILVRTDYPVWDILKVLKENMIQIGKNLARDLILAGIMYTLEVINELCSDNEKVNAPYNPIGAIDLSNFINKSVINGKQTNSLENSASYHKIRSMGISLSQYSKILSVLSSTFTIREMDALLAGDATDKLYAKALATLQDLEFVKDTEFERFYLNAPGIRMFFEVLSGDINPALIAQAKTNFDKEKTILLSMCFGTDDSVLAAELSKHLSPEQLKLALAERAEMPGALVKKLSKNLGEVLGPPVEQDLLCSDTGDGVMLYEDAQRFAAGAVGDTLFNILETTFEREASQIKDIYRGTSNVFKDSMLFGKNRDNQLKNLSDPKLPRKVEEGGDPDAHKALQEKLDEYSKENNIMALPVMMEARDMLDELKFEREEDGSIVFNHIIEYPPLKQLSALRADPPEGPKVGAPGSFAQIASNNAAMAKAISQLVGPRTGISFMYESPEALSIEPFDTKLILGKVISSVEVEDEELAAKMLAEAIVVAKKAHDAAIADADEALQAILPWYATDDPDDDPNSKSQSKFDESTVAQPKTAPILIPEHMEVIAETFINSFGDQHAENALETSITSVLGKGGTGAPHASQAAAAVLERSKNCDFYMTFLNSIFREEFSSGFRSGLFNRSVFNELTFNKKIDFKDCFLGFMNKDLLNKQMQNLAKKLACIDTESPTRTPVNIATIKVALDALVRIITLKAIIKSIFVYNTFTSELIYDGEDSFYDTFLVAELEKTFSEQTEININSEVVRQYITDIMKVIYSDDTLTDDQAFEIVKTTQLNFAKQLMFDIMPGSIAYPTLQNPQTYEFIQDEEGSMVAGNESSELNITLQKVGIADKIQMIQNDVLASYVKVQQGNEITRVEGKSLSAGTNTLEQGTLSGILFERYDTIEPIMPRPPIKYYDQETMLAAETSSLKTLLQGNNSGMILEEMVKFDHNTDFWEKMTPVQQEAFKAFLFSITSDGHWQTYEELKEAAGKNQGSAKEFNKKTDAWRAAADFAIANKNALKDSILNTRLIFLFPQLINIVDSLSFETTKTMTYAPENLWKEYTNTNLFFDMFMFNRDPSYELPSYIKNPELDPDKNLGFTAHGEGARSIEWALTGKMYRSDLKNFINRLPELQVILDPQTGAPDFHYDKDTWLIQPEGQWPSSLVYGVEQTDFYSWFRTKKLNEIVKISTVISLNGYVDIESLDTFKPPSAQTPFSSAIREKIGDIKFEENGTRYYTFPIQESIEPLPSWLTVDEFLGINAIKAGRYITATPKFYDWYAKKDVFKNGNYDLNEVLFHTLTAEEIDAGLLTGTDIYTYLAGLNAITGIKVTKESAVTEYVYESTDWINIRGHVIPYQSIVEHVESGGDNPTNVQGILGDDIPALNFNTAVYHHDPYAYLTPGSYASLVGDSAFWFDEQGFLKTAAVADNIIPMRPDIYDDVKGYSLEGDTYYADRKVIGTWEATNPITAKKVILPKYIRINHRYHLKMNDSGQMGGNFDAQHLDDQIKFKVEQHWNTWITPINPTTNSAPIWSSSATVDVNMTDTNIYNHHGTVDGVNTVLIPRKKADPAGAYYDPATFDFGGLLESGGLMHTMIWRRKGRSSSLETAAGVEKVMASEEECTGAYLIWPAKTAFSNPALIKYRLNVPRNIMDMTLGSKSMFRIYGATGIHNHQLLPMFHEVESYGFLDIHSYLSALRELKHLVFRHIMNYYYDIIIGSNDPKMDVLERSSGWLDIDWGWNFWKIKYDNHSHGTADDNACVPNFGNYVTTQRHLKDGALSREQALAKEKEYPGTYWRPGVWYDSTPWSSGNDALRPVGNKINPSSTYPGNRAPSSLEMIYDPILGTDTIWNKGFVSGGLYAAEKIFKPIPLDNAIRFNIYNVFEKISQKYATHAHTPDDPHGWESLRNPGIDKLVQSFFMKEQFTIIAVITRLLTEKNYPELDKTFSGSIRKTTEILIAAMASAQGDYRKVKLGGGRDNEYTLAEALDDIYQFGKLIVKAVITATANTVDPTWVTPWFFPGPFTPFGILAKYMHSEEEEDEAPGRPLGYVPPIFKQCDDLMDKQIDLLAEITEDEKPK
jgi:hypothetical protein